MKKHGTATGTQLIQVINAESMAVATIVNDFTIGDLINCLNSKGSKLTEYLRLVFIALMTDQTLALGEKVQAVKGTLLELLTAVNVNAVDRFIAADNFKTGNEAGVKFSKFGDNFKNHFLKKVEENVLAAALQVHKLLKASLDAPIITELGDNHESQLAYMWQLLASQPNGEDGVLLTNGYANIFYIRDTDGILWAVSARWLSDGWDVFASSVGSRIRWDADASGCLVADSQILKFSET